DFELFSRACNHVEVCTGSPACGLITGSLKEEPQREENQAHRLEQDICIHMFTVSSEMVGVCLTVIGLIRVVITLGSADTIADDCLAINALLFLISGLLS